MQEPLITVGIPSYNHAAFLAQALGSVTKQTYSNLEIIIVENSSTDDTDEVLSHFKDPRISVIKTNNGGSIAMSRNIVLNKSNGDWIAYLDSDDWWTLDKLHKCAKEFQDGVNLIYHDLIVVNEEKVNSQGKNLGSRKLKKPVFKDLMISGNTIATSSVVVRKSILSEVNGMNESKDLFGIEDFNTWLKISRITEGFKFINQDLGFYRVHSSNISNAKNFVPPIEAYKEFLHLLSDKELKAMENNYNYASTRLNYINGKYFNLRKDLMVLIKHGKVLNRLKSFFMYVMIILNVRKG
jgi:glycosyltransferase involved in cell wall biosynthesis